MSATPAASALSARSRRHRQHINAIQSDIAYSADIQHNITILTSKYATTDNGVIQGLLYVPDIEDSSPCKELESAYIPTTAVRQADLPPSDYNLIALVPWYSPNCTRAYLEAATVDPIRAFITYIPEISTEKPPSVDDEVWNLHDHGAWQTRSKFPVYAVSGTVGTSMMEELGLYSGNASSVPYGENITRLYSPSADDYVRIWTEIHVTTANTLPTMWIFILVCIGVLFGFVALVSAFMHYIQRRRRTSLRHRVMSGEVNLEAMNIKRVPVPIEHVEKFPLFTYNYDPKLSSGPPSPSSPRPPPYAHVQEASSASDGLKTKMAPPVSEKGFAGTTAQSTVTGFTNISTSTDYQPRCTICCDEFDNKVTIIRELSCGHIYHPECIDEYLSENSSLCPQCKASMLPRGYCPEITNGMVRRERALRKLRGRIVVEDGFREGGANGWRMNITRKLFRPSNNASNAVQRVPTAQARSPNAETRSRMRSLAGLDMDDNQSWDGRPRCKSIFRSVHRIETNEK